MHHLLAGRSALSFLWLESYHVLSDQVCTLFYPHLHHSRAGLQDLEE